MAISIASNEPTVIVAQAHHFNWGAVIAGAVVAVAVAFFLVTLGTGFGLAVTSHPFNATFLTLGAIYFFAALAFGFAAGGHLTGRLIGPALENAKEEEFRAGAHGLVTWAIAAGLGLLLAFAAAGGPLAPGNAADAAARANDYWTDTLFRTARTDLSADDLATDKTVAARILAADMVRPNADNARELVHLVVLDTELPNARALSRVMSVEAQMERQAQAARKAAAYASLWTALALLFGAIVSVAAAITARWEDDKISFSFTRRY